MSKNKYPCILPGVVEPQRCLGLCHIKNEEDEWDMISFTKIDETIQIPLININRPS